MKNMQKQEGCHSKLHLLALCVALLGASGVAGANQDETAAAPVRLESVNIEDHSDFQAERVYTEPNSAVYVPLKTLERFRGSSPGDILKGVVGVQVSDNRNGNALDVGIRGIQGQNRTPVVVDGGIQSIDVYRGFAGTQQRSYIDPDLISRIWVEKGPSMGVNAGGAVGGMVEMQTLVPEDILVKGKSYGGRLRLTTANNSIRPLDEGNYKVFNRRSTDRPKFYEASDFSGSVAYALKKDNFSLLGAYVQRQNGNYFAGKHGFDRYKDVKSGGAGDPTSEASVTEFYKQHDEVLDTHSKTKSLLLKGTWQPTDEHRFEAGYRFYNSKFGEIMPSQISRVPELDKTDPNLDWSQIDMSLPNPFLDRSGTMIQHDPGEMKIHAFNLGYSWQPSKYDWINLRANLWATRAYGDMFNSNPDNKPYYRYTQRQNLPGPDSPDYKLASQISTKNDRFGLNLSNTSRFDSRVGEFIYNYSFDYQQEKMQPGKNSPIVIDDLRNNRFVRNAKRQSFNLALSQEWRPIDRLSIDLGLRWTQASVHDNNRKAYVKEGGWKDVRLISVTGETLTAAAYKNIWDKGENIHLKWSADKDGNFTKDSWAQTLYKGRIVAEAFDVDKLYEATVAYVVGWEDPGENYLASEMPVDSDKAHKYTIEKYPFDWGFDDPKRQHDQVWSPHLGLTWRWGEEGVAYLKYANAARLPGMAETTLGNMTAPGSNNLKPERSHSFELGVGKLFRNVLAAEDQVGLKLAYFDTRVKNFITRRGPMTSEKVKEFSHYNVDSFNVRGYELQANYDSGRMFADLSANYQAKVQTCDAEIAQQLRDFGSSNIVPVGLLKESYKSTPNCIDGGFGGAFVNAQNPPKYTINLTLGSRFFDQRLTVGARVIKNSKPLARLNRVWHTYANSGLQKYYLSALVFDAFAEWKINDKADIGVTINNLTDVYYTDPLIMSLMPAPGRTIRMNLNWKF